MSYPPAPNPDKVALMRVGAHVRRRLAADPSIHKVPVETVDIWAVSDFVNAEECTALMAMVDRTAKPSDVLDNGYGSDTWRTSYSGNVDPHDSFVKMIERRIDDFLGLPHEFGETMQGQRYAPGQEFKPHMDWFWTKAPYWKTEAKRGGQRSITAMLYLNDVAEGGTTDFPKVGVSIPPQRGALIVWNNANKDGSLNQDALHAGTPVIAGTKYIITKWYRTRKWG
jgi:prolyl 4-hydroxylase